MILARCRVGLLKLVNFVGFLNQTGFRAESAAKRLVFQNGWVLKLVWSSKFYIRRSVKERCVELIIGLETYCVLLSFLKALKKKVLKVHICNYLFTFFQVIKHLTFLKHFYPIEKHAL